MAPSSRTSKTASVLATAGLFLSRGVVAKGFNGSNNIALYWGQNSYGQATGSLAQQSLAYYCANSNVDIIPMAFLVQVTSGAGGQPVINFANSASNCTLFPGTSLLDCPDIGEDITTCQQKYGKTILLSIGGATYSEGGFASEAAAEMAAELVWRTFGPVNSTSLGTGSSTSISIATSSSIAMSTTSATTILTPGTTISTTSASIIASTTSTSSSSTALTTFLQSTTTSTASAATLTTSTSTIASSSLTSLSSSATTTPLQSTTMSVQSTTMSVQSTTIVTTSASATISTTTGTSSTTATTTLLQRTTTTLMTPTGTQPPWNDRTTPPGTTTTATQTSSFATATPSSVSASSLAYSVTDVFPQAPTTVTTWETSLTTVPCSTSAAATPLSRRQSTTTALRPFHNAVVDGFDLDLETATTNFRAFAFRLRQLMATDTRKPYYLTAAPQCPYPDVADNSMLNGGVFFDAIFVQFYNNYCSASTYPSKNFNFATWNDWALNSSSNPLVKVFLGVPAGETAAGTGYLSAQGLEPVIEYCKGFSSFGGVMAWDASQAYANAGWIEGVKGALNNGTATAKKERRRAVQWIA